MFINIKNIRNTYVVEFQAECLGVAEGIKFVKTVRELAKLKKKHMVLNFDRCSGFDNAFLEQLLFLGKYLSKTGIKISLCGVKPEILCIFYLIKLDKYFEIYVDKYDAVLRENRLVNRKIRAI